MSAECDKHGVDLRYDLSCPVCLEQERFETDVWLLKGEIEALETELRQREHQIERTREWASLKSKEARQRAGGDPYWEGCVDAYDAVVAILSEDASDANETQDSEGSA